MRKIKENYGEIIRYLFIGGLTTAIALLIYYALTFTILDPNNPIQLQLANILQWTGAVVFAYFANKYFVFKKENKDKKEMFKFYLSRIITLLMDMGIMFVFVTLLGFNDKIMKIVAQIVVIVGNYVLSKFFVFKKN